MTLLVMNPFYHTAYFTLNQTTHMIYPHSLCPCFPGYIDFTHIFAQNLRVSNGQGIYSSADEYEEPTVFTLDESENSTCTLLPFLYMITYFVVTDSSGTTQHKLKTSNASNSSPSSSMTNLPSASLTPHSSPKTIRSRGKMRCAIM